MSLSIICQKCGDSLVAPGGLVLGLPGEDSRVDKFHLCEDCYEVLEDWLYSKTGFPKPKPDEDDTELSLQEEKRLYDLESKLKCPKCGSYMRLRQNKTNKTYFFGCSKFPSCRGTRQPDGGLAPKKPSASYSAGIHDLGDDEGYDPDDDIPF